MNKETQDSKLCPICNKPHEADEKGMEECYRDCKDPQIKDLLEKYVDQFSLLAPKPKGLA